MRYVILRRRVRLEEDPLEVIVGAGDPSELPLLPFRVDVEDLSDPDLGDLRHDPNVIELVPSIPLSLIEPFDESVPESSPHHAWGVKAVGATSSPQTGAGVTVAVLDTGIDISHPAFAGVELRPEYLIDFTNDERGTTGVAPDTHGHGTHVAGTIFGRDVNGTRIAIAPGVTRALIGKVLGTHGAPTEAVVNAIHWAVSQRADVICMSLGIDFPGLVREMVETGIPEDIATSRVLTAYRSNVRLFDRVAAEVEAQIGRGRGAILVAAAGNESRRQDNAHFTVATAPPAAADGFVSVGAVSYTGNAATPFAVAPFSNTGCGVAAPGVRILSAKLGGGLAFKSGTSMATPHVAGVITLWTERLFPDGSRPKGWARDVLRELERTVLPASRQDRNDLGLGIVQAPK